MAMTPEEKAAEFGAKLRGASKDDLSKAVLDSMPTSLEGQDPVTLGQERAKSIANQASSDSVIQGEV